MQGTLYRDSSKKVIGGVAAGIAEYLNTDISLIRILFLVFGIWHRFLGSGALVIYILLWIILPDKAKLIQGHSTPPNANPDPVKKDFEANYIVDDLNNPGSKNPGHSPENVNYTSANPIEDPNKSDRRRLAGILLLVVGGLFLIEQNNWISGWDIGDFDFSIVDKFWPLALIILGVWVLVGRKNNKKTE